MLKSYGELDPSAWQGQCFFFCVENADIAEANAALKIIIFCCICHILTSTARCLFQRLNCEQLLLLLRKFPVFTKLFLMKSSPA